MATFKTEIQNKRADGTYNIRIRITHRRVVRRISTPIFATADDLTRSLRIKDTRILKQCDDLLSKCRLFCNDMGYDINALSADALADALKIHLQGGERFNLDFLNYMDQAAARMKKSTGDTYRNAANALRRYLKSETLDISQITAGFLHKFETFLTNEPSQRGQNRKTDKADDAPLKGGRAVSKYIACIRAIHNHAKREFNDEDRRLIRIPYSPFKKFKIKPQPATRKRALTIRQVQKIIDLPDDDTRRGLAKDCFILSFALLGMNSADMYAAPPLDGEILTYNRRKTADRRDDKAEIVIKVDDCLTFVLEKYADDKRLFNFYKRYSDHTTFNRAINIGLKQIGAEIGVDGLEFYAARHSWATIARSAGIDKYTIHEGLNHAPDREMKVTDIYIKKDWSLLWNANKKVLDLFDWEGIGWADLL